MGLAVVIPIESHSYHQKPWIKQPSLDDSCNWVPAPGGVGTSALVILRLPPLLGEFSGERLPPFFVWILPDSSSDPHVSKQFPLDWADEAQFRHAVSKPCLSKVFFTIERALSSALQTCYPSRSSPFLIKPEELLRRVDLSPCSLEDRLFPSCAYALGVDGRCAT